MFAALSLQSLVLMFIASTAVVWIAGVQLSKTTDVIDTYFNLGEAFGGLILLSFATNLPEIAIVISASLSNNLGIAIGNILGGIAIQTVVLVFLDRYGLKSTAALTYKGSSLQIVLEAVLVIIVLLITIMGTQLPASMVFMRIAPADGFIVVTWLIGLWLVYKARMHFPWEKKTNIAIETKSLSKKRKDVENKLPIRQAMVLFLIAALITLIAGALLEESSNAIAEHLGVSGVLVGSTVLAAVTALPEISTGLAAVKLHDYTMAMSDIFGGNAFLPVLFLFATLMSGQSVLSEARDTDVYLACLGALLTAIYIVGLIFKPKRQYFNLGIDSLVVLVVYIIGMMGMVGIVKN